MRSTISSQVRKGHLLIPLLLLAVVLAVAMQFPGSPLDPLSTAAWGLLLLVAVLFTHDAMRIRGYFPFFVACVAGLVCVSAIGAVSVGTPPFSPLLIVVGKALMVYVIGYLLPFVGITEGKLSWVLAVYVLAVVALVLAIRADYFPSLEQWSSQTVYAYSPKNSAGQIIAVAVILLLWFFQPSNRLVNAARVAAASLLGGFLLILQSRASVVALAVCLIFYLVSRANRRFLLLPLAAALIAAVQIPSIASIVDRAFFISKYAGTNIDTFSSGRITVWVRALDVIRDNLLFGTGNYYVDNMYINVLANVGLLGSVFVFLAWAGRASRNLRVIPRRALISTSLATTVQLLTVFYMVESLLEGLPPFGPGVSSMVFWLLSGFYDGTGVKYGAGTGVQRLANPAAYRAADLSNWRPVGLRYPDWSSGDRTESAHRSGE